MAVGRLELNESLQYQRLIQHPMYELFLFVDQKFLELADMLNDVYWGYADLVDLPEFGKGNSCTLCYAVLFPDFTLRFKNLMLEMRGGKS